VVGRLMRGALQRWRRPAGGGTVYARLYVRADCLLCEEAQALLHEFERAGRLDLRLVDIDDDAALQRRYGITIPVLEIDDGPCLEWPFGPADLSRALR
jgi:glutaredoxin